MLEELFGIRYTALVRGTVYGYTLHRGNALVFTLPPTGDPVVIDAIRVPSFGHKATVSAYLERVM